MEKTRPLTQPQKQVLRLLGRTGVISQDNLRKAYPRYFRPLTVLFSRGLVESYGTNCYALTQKATPFMPDIMGDTAGQE